MDIFVSDVIKLKIYEKPANDINSLYKRIIQVSETIIAVDYRSATATMKEMLTLSQCHNSRCYHYHFEQYLIILKYSCLFQCIFHLFSSNKIIEIYIINLFIII